MCRCLCWEAVVSARGGWRMCRCGRRPWVRMRGEVCSVRRGPGHWRRALPPPLMCRSAKYFAMWKYGIVPRVTSPVDFRLILSLCCAVGVLVFFRLMLCEYLVFTLVPRVICELRDIYNRFQHWSGLYFLYYQIWIAQSIQKSGFRFSQHLSIAQDLWKHCTLYWLLHLYYTIYRFLIRSLSSMAKANTVNYNS